MKAEPPASTAPQRPWAMRQTWRDLLFAHWALPPRAVRPLVPERLPLDTFDGRAWLGVVPFRMTGVRLRGLPPIPGAASFPELNVRTYVTLGGRPGVYFLSLDATSSPAVFVARRVFRLPYVKARISCGEDAGDIVYSSERRDGRLPRPAELRVRYRPVGAATTAEPGSLAHWLTERFSFYVVDALGRIGRGDVHHAPWPLQPAAAEFAVNTMAQAAGAALPSEPPVLHFARAVDVRLSWPEMVEP